MTESQRSRTVAALVLLVMLAAAVAVLLGVRGLTVRSASMGPALPVGSLALTVEVDAAEVRAGDVVRVRGPQGGVTHRVVAVAPDGRGTRVLTLRGDQNAEPDPAPYAVSSVDRVVASVPYAGHPVVALTSGPGLVVLGATVVLLAVRRDSRSTAMTLGTAAVVLVAGTSGTAAAFSDSASVVAGASGSPTTAFTSGSVATPTTPTATQTPTSGAVAVTWTATAVGAGSARAERYEVYRYAGPTGGTGTLACTATAPTLTCNDSARSQVTYYAVRAKFAASWERESARQVYAPDAAGPATTFLGPPTSQTFATRQLMQTAIATGCLGLDTPACGQVSDISGIGSVLWQLRRTTVPGGASTCYDSDGKWTSTCASYAATLAVVNGTTRRWSLPTKSSDAYKGSTPYDYALTITSTDGFGNVSSTTLTYGSR